VIDATVQASSGGSVSNGLRPPASSKRLVMPENATALVSSGRDNTEDFDGRQTAATLDLADVPRLPALLVLLIVPRRPEPITQGQPFS
jgi:hypothetical protein